MSRQDFLHRDAQTPLCEHYIAAGAICSLSTNCEQLLEAARESFLPTQQPQDSVDFSLRLWVEDVDGTQPPWAKPYVRGLDHLVFVGVEARSSMLVDLRTRRVIGRVSTAMAADTIHWRRVIFPILLSILAGSIGLVELHASCVARNQRGLILFGPSRSGKSTLAMALTEAGFRFLSDDRTFCSLRRSKLLAYGLPRPLKLRREAAAWFETLRDQEPTDVQNDERVFHCEPKQAKQHDPMCEPRLLVFLEQQQHNGFHMKPMKCREASSRIEGELLAEGPEAVRKQAETLQRLVSLPCYTLQYGGQPQVIAEQLAAFFSNISECL